MRVKNILKSSVDYILTSSCDIGIGLNLRAESIFNSVGWCLCHLAGTQPVLEFAFVVTQFGGSLDNISHLLDCANQTPSD